MKKLKVAGIVAVIVVVVAIVAYGTKTFYEYSYKKGYADGVRQELICAASQRDATLAPLCK